MNVFFFVSKLEWLHKNPVFPVVVGRKCWSISIRCIVCCCDYCGIFKYESRRLHFATWYSKSFYCGTRVMINAGFYTKKHNRVLKKAPCLLLWSFLGQIFTYSHIGHLLVWACFEQATAGIQCSKCCALQVHCTSGFCCLTWEKRKYINEICIFFILTGEIRL